MKIMYLSLLFLILLVRNSKGQTCGTETSNLQRIVNGHDLPYPRKYPWFTALVQTHYAKNIVCGGTLVNERHVMTAAHCFAPFFESVKKGKVKLKDVYLAKLGVGNMCMEENEVRTYSSIKVHINEDYYDKPPYYDIAIMVLNETVTSFVPICLPTFRYDDSTRENLIGTIVGLGKESSTAFRTPCTVKEAKVPIQKQSVCLDMFKRNKFDVKIDNIFCAGETSGGTDTCQGDSGGPLQIYNDTSKTWTILGITSFGFGCAQSLYYGIYTDVSHYNNWTNAAFKYDEDHNYVYNDENTKNKEKNKPRAHNNWLTGILHT